MVVSHATLLARFVSINKRNVLFYSFYNYKKVFCCFLVHMIQKTF